MNKIIRVSLLSLLIITLFLAALPVIQGKMLFHTDIARDMLLVEDIAFNHNITLIGPRAGGIPGVFHGPLWLYLNLPAFIIGNGNPYFVVWFWFLLYILSVGIIYRIGKEMYDDTTALLGMVLYAVVLGISTYRLFNPYGALFTFPLFFYFFYRYLKKQKIVDGLLSYFLIGCLIQFQMAFGVPMLILSTGAFLYRIIKNKKFHHVFIPLIILIPLSTYIVFELRHNYLQIRAVLDYLNGNLNTGKETLNFFELFAKRLNQMFSEPIGMITRGTIWLNFMLFAGVVYGSIKLNKKQVFENPTLLFYFFFIGFWVITLLYKGVMWDYYYWPFTGVMILAVVSIYKYIDTRIFLLLFFFIFACNVKDLIPTKWEDKNEVGGWNFYKTAAEKVFTDAPSDFGYYIFTTDQYGYSSRYAMNYMQRLNPTKKANPFQKRTSTYLLIDDDGNNVNINNQSWKKYDIKITSKPSKIEQLSRNYVIEKYNLTDEETKIESNPNLIQNLIFR